MTVEGQNGPVAQALGDAVLTIRAMLTGIVGTVGQWGPQNLPKGVLVGLAANLASIRYMVLELEMRAFTRLRAFDSVGENDESATSEANPEQVLEAVSGLLAATIEIQNLVGPPNAKRPVQETCDSIVDNDLSKSLQGVRADISRILSSAGHPVLLQPRVQKR